MKLAITGLVAVLAISTAGVAAEKARNTRNLKALGLKAYFRVLDEDQKAEAKEIIADHLAATQADRLAAAARLIRYRADVAALLTEEQRKQAMKLRWTVRKLPQEKRTALLDALLDKTDRAALASKVESIQGAAPASQVEIGLSILDQVHALLLEEGRTRFGLTADQVAGIGDLYGEFRVDIQPVALRLAEARAETTRRGLSILRPEQREKLDAFRDTVREKVLAFLGG